MQPHYQTYAHRLREAVTRIQDLKLVDHYGIPHSTAQSWIRRGIQPVASYPEFDEGTAGMALRIAGLGWIRPRRRVHPPKPKMGIRASRSNEYWHIDVSLIRLLDGTRVYIHGVIDNFSRKRLARNSGTTRKLS